MVVNTRTRFGLVASAFLLIAGCGSSGGDTGQVASVSGEVATSGGPETKAPPDERPTPPTPPNRPTITVGPPEFANAPGGVGPPQASTGYRIVDLGTLNNDPTCNTSAGAGSISLNGYVAVISCNQPAVWDPTTQTMTALVAPLRTSVNDTNGTVSAGMTLGSLNSQAGVWRSGTYSPVQGDSAIDVNTPGDVLVTRMDRRPVPQAPYILHTDGTTTVLQTPSGCSIPSVTAMNDLGVVVGTSCLGPTIWRDGVPTAVQALPNMFCIPWSINSAGQSTGYCRDESSGTPVHTVVIWDASGAITALSSSGITGAMNSEGLNIAEDGTVQGWVQTTTFEQVPVQWATNGTATDLRTLVDPADPLAGAVTFTQASGKDTYGNILLTGTRSDGRSGAFLLDPQ